MEMMTVAILTVINLGVTYTFFYYALHSIKNKVSIAWSALVLLILLSLSMMTCPVVLSVMKKCLGLGKMIDKAEAMMMMEEVEDDE